LNITQYPFIFSPGFTKYIDVDSSQTHIIIRDTLRNEQLIASIPEQLLSSKNEKLLDIVRRFHWIDEDTIQVINSEGVERLVDVTNNFKEI